MAEAVHFLTSSMSEEIGDASCFSSWYLLFYKRIAGNLVGVSDHFISKQLRIYSSSHEFDRVSDVSLLFSVNLVA